MKQRLFALAALTLLTATPAWASPLTFSFVGEGSSFSFQLDSRPAPYATSDDQTTFELTPIGLEGGRISDFGGGVYFYTSDFDNFSYGGIATVDGNFSTSGAQVFSGPVSAPVFATGRYSLIGFDGVTPDGVLTISAPSVAAAPEPTNWLLMIMGVTSVGWVMRRQRRQAKFGPALT